LEKVEMGFSKFFGAAIIAAFTCGLGVQASGCRSVGSIEYCNDVPAIRYDNIGFSGTYKDVSFMDPESCKCEFKEKSFGGGLAPLDEELSLHVRGPIKLKKVAVYQLSSNKKKREEHLAHLKRHAHGHMHKRALVHTTVTATVTVTADEIAATPAPAAKGAENKGDKAAGADKNDNAEVLAPAAVTGKASITTRAAQPSASPSKPKGNGKWQRVGYYDAAAQKSEGLVFMNHKGGQGSGGFDKCWGNSLSYASSDLASGASSPQVLKDMFFPSDVEFVIFSDQKCSGNDCGYHYPGIPAYHGFGGKHKVFMFEFQMPEQHSGGLNSNMPAIWTLNAKIPRTAQYGACSCWDSGCGELDLFEVLQGAPNELKSHYHSKQGASGPMGYGGGGSRDYVARPYNKFIKGAVVFDGNKAADILVLPDNFDFAESLDDSDFAPTSSKASVFSVPL